MSDEARWLVCAHCGQPLVGATNDPDQFEDPDDAEAAGPVLHPECVEPAVRELPTARVYFYEEGSPPGPLSRGD